MPKKKTDKAESPQVNIEEIIQQRDEYLSGWKRSLADLENFKKQAETHKEQSLSLLKAKVISEILPIVGNFEKAFSFVPADAKDSEWIKGMAAIKNQMEALLTHNGVEKIKTVGEQFDPNLHEAVMQETREGIAPDLILEEFEPGYKIGDRVITYPKVKVSN